MEWWYNRLNHSCLSLWFVQNPTNTISSAPTPTFVGFPYNFISFVSTCHNIFGTFSWPIFKHYPMNKISLYNYHWLCFLPTAFNIILISITSYVPNQIHSRWILTLWYVYNMPNRVHWNDYSMVKPYAIIIYYVPAKAVNTIIISITNCMPSQIH